MTVVENTTVTTPLSERKPLMGGANDIHEAKDVDDVLRLSGLDWEPLVVPVTAKYKGVDVPTGHSAVLRSDTGKSLGVVGGKFVPVGNRELVEFGQMLVNESDIPWEVGGSLKGGEMPFLQFRLPDGIEVAGMDPVHTYFMLTNGHGGSAALTATVTPMRLFCGNQVRSSRLRYSNYRIRHSGNIEAKIDEARHVLGITVNYMKEFEAIANSLADIDVDLTFFEDFVDELLPIKPDAGVRTNNAVARQRGQFRLNWHNTESLDPDLKATGWGALNVVTEVIDHGDLTIRKSSQDKEERKFLSSLQGNGAKIRDRAFDLLLGEIDNPGGITERANERRLVLAGAN